MAVSNGVRYQSEVAKFRQFCARQGLEADRAEDLDKALVVYLNIL